MKTIMHSCAHLDMRHGDGSAATGLLTASRVVLLYCALHCCLHIKRLRKALKVWYIRQEPEIVK